MMAVGSILVEAGQPEPRVLFHRSEPFLVEWPQPLVAPVQLTGTGTEPETGAGLKVAEFEVDGEVGEVLFRCASAETVEIDECRLGCTVECSRVAEDVLVVEVAVDDDVGLRCERGEFAGCLLDGGEVRGR